MKKNSLKIALIGTRGAPARYGGFETCVEEVGTRLAQKGHDVTVYCRTRLYAERPLTYMGMKLVYLPSIPKRSLETLSHTLLSVCHAVFRGYDVFMVFNAANSIAALLPRLLGKKVVINTDGLEWKRSKWGPAGRTFYRLSERVACRAATRLVSDSRGMREYYLNTHKTDSTEIAYGAYTQTFRRNNLLEELGLQRNEYFLQITRFEPENHPLLSIEAFKKLDTGKKMVLVGGNPYPTTYTEAIEKEAGGNVILPGFVYDPELLRDLWCSSFAYIHGNSVGGTNPALLQAMASHSFVMAIENPFNRDVLSDCGMYFEGNHESLYKKMRWSLDNEDALGEFKKKAVSRITKVYSWERIADQYENLFYEAVAGEFT